MLSRVQWLEEWRGKAQRGRLLCRADGAIKVKVTFAYPSAGTAPRISLYATEQFPKLLRSVLIGRAYSERNLPKEQQRAAKQMMFDILRLQFPEYSFFTETPGLE